MLTVDKLRGSLRRCLTFTGLPRHETAENLTTLARPSGAIVSVDSDIWRPRGLRDHKETTLVGDDAFVDSDVSNALKIWWLVKVRGANLPNWDIASTCTLKGTKGLILVEAKAHDTELSIAGKSLPVTPNGQINHRHIKTAIRKANIGLNTSLKGWKLSRDSHYQLSNRFAWAWKLASLGVPVVLIYLGFQHAEEMVDQGQPFASKGQWEACLRAHASGIVPDDAWGKKVDINGTPVWFLMKSLDYH